MQQKVAGLETSFYIARLNKQGNSANMKFYFWQVLSLSSIFLLAGCATIFHGTKNPVYMHTQPAEVPIFINNKQVAETPISLNEKFSLSKKIVSIRLNESEKYNKVIESKFRPISLLGLPLVVPFVVDMVTGAIKAHPPQSIYHNFGSEASNWPFQLSYQDGTKDIDPYSVFEAPKKSMGDYKSNPKNNENYLIAIGNSLTGSYKDDDPNFTLSFRGITDSSFSIIPGKMVNAFESMSSNNSSIAGVLPKEAEIGVEYVKIPLSKFSMLNKDIEKKAKTDNLVQFWPVLVSNGGQKVLFQAFSTKSGSDYAFALSDDLIKYDYYFIFGLYDGEKLIHISEQEFKANYSLFSSSPYLKELMEESDNYLELQANLNQDPSFLANILAYQWSEKNGTAFFEFLPSKNFKKNKKPQAPIAPRENEPAVIADGNKAFDDNNNKLNTYSNTLSGTKPTGNVSNDDSDKYYGSEAPWYLQGQLKPEYRKSAAELGLKEEELYDPTPAKIDSTKWLKEPMFELVAPDLKPFKAGTDPGYINDKDPRKKPTEVEETPWYLKTPAKKEKKTNEEPSPKGKN